MHPAVPRGMALDHARTPIAANQSIQINQYRGCFMKKAVILASVLALTACQTATDPLTGQPQRNNTAGGAALGAVAGAVTGLLIAKDKKGDDQRKAALITGVVCGVRVEDIEDTTMRRLRYLDKLIDELAKGKAMDKILRA